MSCAKANSLDQRFSTLVHTGITLGVFENTVAWVLFSAVLMVRGEAWASGPLQVKVRPTTLAGLLHYRE